MNSGAFIAEKKCYNPFENNIFGAILEHRAVTAVLLVRTNNAGGQSKADGP